MARFHDLYDEQAIASPSAPALACHRPPKPRVELSYGQVRARSLELAAGLRDALAAATGRGGSPSALEAGARLVLGILLARTHEDFLPLLVAASRCGATFVLLSTDLREKELEVARNELIVKELRPCLFVVAAGAEEGAKALAGPATPRRLCGSATACGLSTLAIEERSSISKAPLRLSNSAGLIDDGYRGEVTTPLCFVFTGGTRRGRCVAVTHAMVHHERAHYAECARLAQPVRVLANTSVYWGASALGQLSIALAYGGCAVLCEASETDELRAAISAESVDVIGLVPDQLRALATHPAAELPSLRLVFTWGEALPAAVAERWRGHPRAKLRELLISTEYWLSLYAAPLEDGGRFHRAVRGVRLLIVAETGEQVSEGEVGELLLAGPMVTSGYVQISCSTGADAADAFWQLGGELWFRTRDLVRVVPGGLLEFCGRADMTTKVKGKWVDLLSLEETLRTCPGVLAAALLPDPRGGAEPHAFVVLERGGDAAASLGAARESLPRTAQLHVVEKLPRHPVTKKVDIRALERIAAPGDVGTWPLAPDAPAEPKVLARAREKLRRHGLWTLAAAVVASTWDLQAFLHGLRGSRSGKSGLEVCTPRVTALGFLLFPYMHHGVVTKVDRWAWLDRWLKSFPLGMWGAMLLALALPGAAPRSSWLQRVCRWSTIAWAVGGAGTAWAGGRLLSFPIVFWMGIGHRFEYDCARWLHWRMWSQHFRWYLGCLSALLPSFRSADDTETMAEAADDAQAAAEAAAEAAAVVVESTAEAEPKGPQMLTCCCCGKEMRLEWPPQEPSEDPAENGGAVRGGACTGTGESCCWCCWPERVRAALQKARELAPRALVEGPPAAPPATAPPLAPPAAEAQVPAAEATDTQPGPPLPAAEAAPAAEAVPAAEAIQAEEDSSSQQWTPQEVAEWHQRRFETWWWYNKTQDVIDVKPEVVAQVLSWRPASASSPQPSAEASGEAAEEDERAAAEEEARAEAALANDPRLRRLCRCFAQVEGDAAAASPFATLHGLDSLHVALLATRVRAEFGLPSLSVGAVRRAATLAELLETVDSLQRQAVDATEHVPKATSAVPERADYKLAYSPGQHAPMGAWVLRSDTPVDASRLEQAVGLLVERHVSLRARPRESMRLLSFFLDTGILFTLAARHQDRLPWPFRALRRLFSWAIFDAWPCMSVAPRSEVYARHTSEAPFGSTTVCSQNELGDAARHSRNALQLAQEPLAVSLVRMEADLEGLWVCGLHGGEGEIAILRTPGKEEASGSELIVVDSEHGQAGVLVGPGDERWRHPPYGFPALFSAQLRPGRSVVWLRMARRGELTILWKPEDTHEARWRWRVAFRMPGARLKPHLMDFLVVNAMHSVADGHSFEPVVGDLLALYASLAPAEAGSSKAMPLPPLLGDSFQELESRLYSALHVADPRASPQQISFRGSLWKFHGRGYGHLLGLQRGAVACLKHVGRLYGAPLDALLLALTAASIARASKEDLVLLTLYVPLRDAPGESGLVGLFADWRELTVHVDAATATVLGVVLDVAHALRLRRWAVFNALRKPESTVVNFQPLDAAPRGSRSGFTQIGEELWRIKEDLGPGKRSDKMDWVPQRLSVTIEQQDQESWWLLLGCAARTHPPAYMRRFVKAFEDAFWALLMDPVQKVHTEYPEGFSLPERGLGFDAEHD